jgi:L-serine dehydratase
MFLSVFELFKQGVGPSSSHTMGPMVAAGMFRKRIADRQRNIGIPRGSSLRCVLKGSLAFTGKGHATDRAVAFGLHGYLPAMLVGMGIDALAEDLWGRGQFRSGDAEVSFRPSSGIVFDYDDTFPEHPNGMLFELVGPHGETTASEVYFSIGGGFVRTRDEMALAPHEEARSIDCPHPFDSAATMLQMSQESGATIAEMKRRNELASLSEHALNEGLDSTWRDMESSLDLGLMGEGVLPGGLGVERRAGALLRQLSEAPNGTAMSDWLCAYAMAVCEENAAGHAVVTAPTNGAAGVVPAVLAYLVRHEGAGRDQVREFLLTAAAIGGLIKHRASISGAEVGCQGEVGTASAMAAAGACAVRGGSAEQVENAAEMALEHHLGMTCDPVRGLVQVPCIERNGFGAVKACVAASLALRGSGKHFTSLDACIQAMKETGLEMSCKFKETSLGGLAVACTEC